mmetsp:Transcript_93615/g.136743  ORF Transcript_93615/g.136743 Transcript_93615/m.136743 type:complete len:100 (-) Transcript_93615:108-407(-)
MEETKARTPEVSNTSLLFLLSSVLAKTDSRVCECGAGCGGVDGRHGTHAESHDDDLRMLTLSLAPFAVLCVERIAVAEVHAGDADALMGRGGVAVYAPL